MMTDLAMPVAWMAALVAGAAGLGFGFFYFRSVRRTAELLVAGSGGRPVLPILVRLAAAGGFFLVAASQGTAPLAGAFAGFLAGRSLAVRRRGPTR